MARFPSIAISTGLIVSGVIACALTERTLVENTELSPPLNPLGINGSPYGEVFAMAMQSPIDNYFHVGTGGEIHRHAPGETCADHEQTQHVHDENCDHDQEGHVHDENCGHDQKETEKESQPSASLKTRFRRLLYSLDRVREVRTNPKAPGEAHKRHLRRQAEDKLRFAYRLDPSHYANYNSLHLFLTESQIGTRPQLTSAAAELARETIDYCLNRDDDPRPALTAASAAGNILDLMFNDRHNPTPRFTTAQMRDVLKLLDHCLARYQMLAKHWDETKNWELLSPMRIKECNDRFYFITKVREASEITLTRLEQEEKN